MRKNTLSIILLATVIAYTKADAQVASKKGVTLEEIHLQINNLSVKNDEASKELLSLEAKELVKSNNEKWVVLGASLLESLQQKAEAQKAFQLISKKFPRGIYARAQDYNKIFDKNSGLSVLERDKLFKSWLLKFPEDSFEENEKNIYLEGHSNMAVLFINENNIDRAISYIEKFKYNPNFPIYINRVGMELIKHNNHDLAISLLEPAYNAAYEATLASSNAKNKVAVARSYYNIAPNYAKALAESEKNERAIEILEELNKKTSGKNVSSIRQLANLYTKSGRDLDAFLLVQNYLMNHEDDERLIEDIRTLYSKLNQNNPGNIEGYITALTMKSHEALLSKYKAEMVKKEAKNFALVNLTGETVSLADLKGKVVVLDFWATWCGPCKASFPGMQAAVNKFKDDKEVEFLFIDVWQKEENYKELAQQFLTDNNYSFNVLFDEMKDRPKSTATAYGVRGIPTKIIIDKEGFIRFESAGGNTEVSKIVSEMSAKIELAKRG